MAEEGSSPLTTRHGAVVKLSPNFHASPSGQTAPVQLLISRYRPPVYEHNRVTARHHNSQCRYGILHTSTI